MPEVAYWEEWMKERLAEDKLRARRILTNLLPTASQPAEQQEDNEPPPSLCDNC